MYYVRRANKYGAKSTVYEGQVYDSKLEAGYAQELDLRVRAKDIKSWRRQVKVELFCNGERICNYYVDFEITHNDGTIEFIECKGFETEVWRLKRKLLEANFKEQLKQREIIYTVVKEKSNWGAFKRKWKTRQR